MNILIRIAAAGLLFLAPAALGAVSPRRKRRIWGRTSRRWAGRRQPTPTAASRPWTGGIRSARPRRASRPTSQAVSTIRTRTRPTSRWWFTITPRQRCAQYAAKLTEGHKALFKAYADYKMIVYPGRTAVRPRRRASTRPPSASPRPPRWCRMATGIPAVRSGRHPFPIPKSGLEVYWNHLTRYRGIAAARQVGQVPVEPGGNYTVVNLKEEFFFPYYVPGMTEAGLDNIIVYFMQETTAPARLAGEVLLVQGDDEPVKDSDRAAPGSTTPASAAYCFGTPRCRLRQPGHELSDNQRTDDQFDMYSNAQPPALRLALVSTRRRMYVPYNSYQLQSEKDQVQRAACRRTTSSRTTRVTSSTVSGWSMPPRQVRRKSHLSRMAHPVCRRGLLADPRRRLLRQPRANCGACSEAAMPSTTTDLPTLGTDPGAGDGPVQTAATWRLGLRTNEQPQALYDFTVKRTAADYQPSVLERRGIR